MADRLNELPDLSTLPTSLPAFASNLALPQGDFAPTKSEFEARFVSVGSPDRSGIYSGWADHRRALLGDGLPPVSRQLLDGSYTTGKADPGDLDLAVEVPLAGDERPPAPEEPIGRLLLGARMKPRFNCDAYPIYSLPVDHPLHERVTAPAVRYWTKWFGTDRHGETKGRVWSETRGLR
jgi:hypothetical protein